MFLFDAITSAVPALIALWQTGFYMTFNAEQARDYLEASQIAKGRM